MSSVEPGVIPSEAKFRGLLESAPDGVVIVDGSGAIVLANAQAHRMFGYDAGELSGQAVEILVPAARHARHREHRTAYERMPSTRPMGSGLDLVGRRKDGSEFPVEISLSPLETPEGRLVTSIVRDITERKKAEAERTRLNEELSRRVGELNLLNRELEAFSYSISHDLRAPLRGIDGFSQALLDEYADIIDEQGRDYLRRIRAASQRMAALIDDLLALSRVTRSEMRREPVDLSALARAIAAQLERVEPGRRVEWDIPDGVIAEGDPPLLRLVLENLLGNAWKFTSRRETAWIEFGVARSHGAEEFFVRDNGVGFDMAYAEKLFGAFQRLHAMHEFPGTGIGLATVQRIVHRHGGRVRAHAVLDQGATFAFTLDASEVPPSTTT
jgi:PAS domain S-box-containing protein